jgi:ankyrin repeat protein
MENGHKRFADYLFKTLNISTTLQDNIAELVHHVAMSGNSDYETMLFAHVKSLLQNNRQLKLKLLFQVVRDYNSYHTSELMLTLTNLNEVNEIDNNNHSLSFAAARQGNEESLRCLLDRGANQNFTVILETSINNVDSFQKSHDPFYSGHNIVQICKYVFFCGYNILQIAAQNGHQSVVKMLLDRHKRLAYVENDMHLNAFHLAVENGHFEIMNMFLKMNSSLADIISLYQASKNGNKNIVQTLLSYGVIDQCVPFNGTFYWLPLLSNRKQQRAKINNVRTEYGTVSIKTYFYDDWRLITCETALNAAVRKGHLDVVDILMKEENNALRCTTYDGKTPLMTAVRYNQTEIFKLLHYNNSMMSLKCEHSFNIFDIYFQSKLDISERAELITERCPSGASVVHLLAMHGNFDMLLFMYQSGFSDWDLRDTDNATPLHYAFCHNTDFFIMAAHELRLNFTTRTLNMSTIFHSAAICKGLSLYQHSRNDYKYKLNVTDVVDKDGRSILHYSMLMPLEKDGRVRQGKIEEDGTTWSIFVVCLDFKHNFHLTDHEGRNFLHYAAKSGNYHGFVYTPQLLSDKDLGLLLKKKDKMGKTPLDEAFYSMPKHETFEVLRIPSGCEIKDVFYTFCRAKHDLILTDHEMVIWKIALYLNKHGGFSEYNITDMLLTTIRKSRVYPILIFKTYATDAFKHAILTNPDILNVVTEYEGPNIAEFILTTENALNCNGGFSPLHRIIFNDRNTQWVYCNIKFLDKYLLEFPAQKLDVCFDSDGYTLLHRAIMGGNIIATQYLVNKGMNTSKTSLSGLSPLFISVTKAPYLENSVLPSYYMNGSTIQILQFVFENTTTNVFTDSYGVVDYDTTSAFILQTLYQSKSINDTTLAGYLCMWGEKELGLIHLAAAKGLVTFLKESRSLFDSNILKCYDYNNITPLYLAQIYNQTIVIQWMKDIQVHRVQPKPEVESLLIYNSLSNYRTFRIFDWTCRLQYSYRHAGIILQQVKKCLSMMTNHDSSLLYRNPFIPISVGIIYTTLQSLHNITIIPKLGLPLCNFNMLSICSSIVAFNNAVLRQVKALHKVVYICFRKQIQFGSFDSIYLYQLILRYVLKQSELKYVKELSFHSVFSFHFRYLERLNMRKDIHKYWLSQLTEHLQMEYNFTFLSFVNHESKMMLWLISLVQVSEIRQLIGEKAKHYHSEIEEYSKNHHLCQDCNIDLFLEDYEEICSVIDVFEQELICVVEITYYGLSEVTLLRYVNEMITHLTKKAKTGPISKKRIKLYQRISSMILYFMQFIPEYRKSTICMRCIILLAEKSVKMSI